MTSNATYGDSMAVGSVPPRRFLIVASDFEAGRAGLSAMAESPGLRRNTLTNIQGSRSTCSIYYNPHDNASPNLQLLQGQLRSEYEALAAQLCHSPACLYHLQHLPGSLLVLPTDRGLGRQATHNRNMARIMMETVVAQASIDQATASNEALVMQAWQHLSGTSGDPASVSVHALVSQAQSRLNSRRWWRIQVLGMLHGMPPLSNPGPFIATSDDHGVIIEAIDVDSAVQAVTQLACDPLDRLLCLWGSDVTYTISLPDNEMGLLPGAPARWLARALNILRQPPARSDAECQIYDLPDDLGEVHLIDTCRPLTPAQRRQIADHRLTAARRAHRLILDDIRHRSTDPNQEDSWEMNLAMARVTCCEQTLRQLTPSPEAATHDPATPAGLGDRLMRPVSMLSATTGGCSSGPSVAEVATSADSIEDFHDTMHEQVFPTVKPPQRRHAQKGKWLCIKCLDVCKVSSAIRPPEASAADAVAHTLSQGRCCDCPNRGAAIPNTKAGMLNLLAWQQSLVEQSLQAMGDAVKELKQKDETHHQALRKADLDMQKVQEDLDRSRENFRNEHARLLEASKLKYYCSICEKQVTTARCATCNVTTAPITPKTIQHLLAKLGAAALRASQPPALESPDVSGLLQVVEQISSTQSDTNLRAALENLTTQIKALAENQGTGDNGARRARRSLALGDI